MYGGGGEGGGREGEGGGREGDLTRVITLPSGNLTLVRVTPLPNVLDFDFSNQTETTRK